MLFRSGKVITIRNFAGAGAVTINRGAGVSLYRAGNASNSNATIAANGLVTIVQEDADVWVVSGTGLS